MKRIANPRGLGFALLGALLYSAAFPPLEWASLAWLAPLCFLKAVEGEKASARFRFLFGAGYLVAALGVFWLWSLFRFATLFLWAIFAFYFGLWGLLAGDGAAPSRWVRVLRPAMAWCGVEYFRGELAPLCFSWLSLGYSQQNAIGSTLAPWIGVYGISFLMVLWATGLWEVLHRLGSSGRARAARIVLAGVPVLVFPFLAVIPIRQWNGPPVGTAALQQFVQGDEPGVETGAKGKEGIEHRFDGDGDFDTDTDSDSEPGFDTGAGHEIESPVDLLVWPEYSFYQDPMDRNGGWVFDTVRQSAAPTKWGMVFGAIDIPQGQNRQEAFYNTAWFLSPDGELLGGAIKNQPIQLINDGLPAADVTVIPIDGTRSPRRPGEQLRLGVGICYDGSYQRFARRMALENADILIFPTFNAAAWGAVQHRQHQRMFQTRAMETGLPVLTAAYSGPTFAATPNGGVAASLPFGERERIRVDIPAPKSRITPMVVAGWWIGPICLLSILLAAVLRLPRLVSSLLDRFSLHRHP